MKNACYLESTIVSKIWYNVQQHMFQCGWVPVDICPKVHGLALSKVLQFVP